jgi:RND family efflux transporter MFP subunit
VVRATFDGVIAKRSHNPGDSVEAAASDPVLRVIDPRRLEVVASAPLADAARIRVGAAAHVTGGAVDVGELALKVVAGPVAVEPGMATVPVRLAPAGAMRLPAGTPIDVSIEAERHATAILVPAVAIVREGEETSVFVVTSGKAKKRAVKLGLADGDRIEIASGLKAGEVVIVDGQNGLPDDAAVSATPAGDATKPAGDAEK